MNELKERVRAQIAAIRAAFERLKQREQLMVAGGGAAVLLIILFLVGLMVSSAIESAENRVRVKTDQMAQVLALQGEYRAREAQRQARMNELKRVTNELKNVARDCNGDVAAIGNNLIVVTPNGMRIDRNKMRGGFH